MSTQETPQPAAPETQAWCPKCGAALDGNETLRPEAASPVDSCDTCGKPLAVAPVNDYERATRPATPPPARNPLAMVVAALVAAGLLFFGFHMARRAGASNTQQISKSSMAPDFSLQTLDGKSMRLSDLRGKVVLLNFWATWCGPCKIETPWLVELQNEYGSQGLQVIGVEEGDDSKEEIQKFSTDMGVNYPILLGKEEVGDAYGGVPALPETFFIGRDGKILDKIIGLKGREDIEESVKKALRATDASGQPTPVASLPPQN